jgi:hypothetical protein
VLVTDRADGGSVAELPEPLPMEAAVWVGLQVARALIAAHREGLVHGDVRPGNVLLGRDGALLFDFGIAGVARLGELRPGETAPEVLDGAPPSERSDLYGLGLVLHAAATGRPAFDGPTAWARIGRQRQGTLAVDDLPAGLATTLRHLLHPDPLQRPPSALAVVRMLRRVQHRPDRQVALPRRWFAPLKLRPRWGVHGIDPSTGAAAMFRQGITRTEARRLARRLEGEGWQARADPLALGPTDLVWVTLGALLVGAVLPLVGLPLGAVATLRWRSARTRHELPQALPDVLAPLPPRRLPPGGEAAVLTGLLLLVTAVTAVVSGWVAMVPLMGALAVMASAWRAAPDPPSVVARRGRIEGALRLARRQLDRAGPDELPLDALLGRMGALDALEEGWRSGQLSDEEVLGRLQEAEGGVTNPARTLPTR